MYFQNDEDSSGIEQARRAYQAPQLALYGRLVDLTATGSGSASESNSGSNSDMPCTPLWKAHNSCVGM